MKRIALIFWALVASVPVAAQSPAGRIGVIDVQRLVQESALGKEAFNRVKKLNDDKAEQMSKMQKELTDLEKKLADQGPSLNEEKREELQKQYQEKAVAFKRFQDDAQREVAEAQDKELKELERRVLPVIAQVGKERGLSLIFNKFNAGLLYADEGIDITEDVIKRFNTQIAVPETKSQGPASKPAPKSAPKKEGEKKPESPKQPGNR